MKVRIAPVRSGGTRPGPGAFAPLVASTLRAHYKRVTRIPRALSASTRREVSNAMPFVLFAALVVLGVAALVVVVILLARRWL